MKKIFFKNIILFMVGFCVYITIEVMFRGYSYPLMGCCAGIALIVLDKINDRLSFDVDVLFQCMVGSAIVTLMEFIIGSISLLGYLPKMWDYSSLMFNYKGIICLPFSIVWIFLSFIGIILADAINYYVFEETECPYYKLFGKVIFSFKQKHCT